MVNLQGNKRHFKPEGKSSGKSMYYACWLNMLSAPIDTSIMFPNFCWKLYGSQNIEKPIDCACVALYHGQSKGCTGVPFPYVLHARLYAVSISLWLARNLHPRHSADECRCGCRLSSVAGLAHMELCENVAQQHHLWFPRSVELLTFMENAIPWALYCLN